MPWRITGIPRKLRDVQTRVLTLEGIRDLQYTQGKVMAIRPIGGVSSDWSILQIYDPPFDGDTRVSRIPGLKVSIDIEDRLLGGKNVLGAGIAVVEPDVGTRNVAVGIDTVVQSVETGLNNTIAIVAGAVLVIGAIVTLGSLAVTYFLPSFGIAIVGVTGGTSTISFLGFGAAASTTITVPVTAPVALGLVAFISGPAAATFGVGGAFVGIGGTAALVTAATATVISGAVASTVIIRGLAATTWGLQDVADKAEYGFARARLPASGSVDVDLGPGGSGWTNVPGFGSLFQGHIITTRTGAMGTSWYRTHIGIPPVDARPTSYTNTYSLWQERADALAELERIKRVSPSPPADIDTQIAAADRLLSETDGTFLEAQRDLTATRVYQNLQAANGSDFDRLIRTFPQESVSITKFKDTFIAIRGGRLAEVRLGSIGNNDIIADFTTEYTTLDSGRGIVFQGAPPITTDDDRYIYFVGAQPTGQPDEFEEVLWRIELTNLELPPVRDEIYPRGFVVSKRLPTAISGTGKPPYTYTLVGTLPTGLSYNRVSRRISGTIERTARAGTYGFAWRVIDQYGAIVDQPFNIVITTDPYLPKPVIGPYPVGSPTAIFSFPVVLNIPPNVSYFYRLIGRPALAGMPRETRNRQSGRLVVASWRPRLIATDASRTRAFYAMTLRATPRGAGSENLTVLEQDFIMEIFQPNRPPVIDPIPVITGEIGTQLSYTATATDPDGDTIAGWSKDGRVPWATVHSRTGNIQGVPNVAGMQTFTLNATDSRRLTGRLDVTFNITGRTTDVPWLPQIRDRIYPRDVAINAFQLSGVIVPSTITEEHEYVYSATGLPPGLIFNPDNRFISGTPTTDGVYNVRYRASRTKGTQGAAELLQRFTITITGAVLNQPDLEYAQNTLVPARIDLARVTNFTEGVTYTYEYEQLPAQLVYFAPAHVLTSSGEDDRWPSEGIHNVRITATPSDESPVVRASFTITIGPGSDGSLVQDDLVFIQNRNIPTVPFARVENGPATSVYRYTISGTAPTGMTMTPNGVGGTPSTIQSVDVTLRARATSAGADDPNSPYTTEFSISIIPDPTISGITLGVRNKSPVGTDSSGRPIYELFVGEKPRLFWETRNLNLRDNNSYRVSVGGGSRSVVSDEDGTHISIGAGYISHQSDLFNNLVSNFRQATNPFKDLAYFTPLGAKSSRVSSFSVYGPGALRKSFTGRFFHSAGSRVLTFRYYDNQLRDIESNLTTGLTYPGTTGRATTPTTPSEHTYTATLTHVPGAPDYSGITFVTRSSDSEGDIIPPGRITGLYQARRGGTDATPDPPKSHSIRIRWIPHPLVWPEDDPAEPTYEVFGGESYATVIGTLGAAEGGTLPYKYSLHGTLLPGMVTEPYMRLDTQIDKSVRRDYLEAEEQATPPRIFGTAPNNNLGYAGLYQMVVDSSPTPQVIYRLIRINLYPV